MNALLCIVYVNSSERELPCTQLCVCVFTMGKCLHVVTPTDRQRGSCVCVCMYKECTRVLHWWVFKGCDLQDISKMSPLLFIPLVDCVSSSVSWKCDHESRTCMFVSCVGPVSFWLQDMTCVLHACMGWGGQLHSVG